MRAARRVRARVPAVEWELYDLQVDPAELHNVYGDPAYAEIREELKAAMWREQARLGDAPHDSQPAPAGVDDVVVAEPIPRRPFSFPFIKGGAAGQEPSQDEE